MIDLNALTQQDVDFLKTLKARGVGGEEALTRLRGVSPTFQKNTDVSAIGTQVGKVDATVPEGATIQSPGDVFLQTKGEVSPTSVAGRLKSAERGAEEAREAGLERVRAGVEPGLEQREPLGPGEFIREVALPTTAGIAKGAVGAITGALGGFFEPEVERLGEAAQETISAVAPIIPEPVKEKTKAALQTISEAIPEEQKQLFADVIDTLRVFDIVPVGLVAERAAQVGVRGAAAVAEEIPGAAKAVKEVAEEGVEIAGEVTEAAAKKLFPEESLEKITARITQGTPDEIADAEKALSLIDKEGIETFEDLTKAAVDKRSILSREIDDELLEIPDIRKGDDLMRVQKVGDRTIRTNFIERGIEDLEDLFTKIGDDVELAKLEDFKVKVESEGLNLKEINDFARNYGVQFKSKAFTKTGNPKEGINAVRFESNRKGLKETVRQFLPDEKTRILDREISTLFDLEDSVSKLRNKAAAVQNKLQRQNLLNKVGVGAAQLADIASGRFFSTLIKGRAGTLNAADLEKELVKNLLRFEKALTAKTKEATVEALK